jgi:hypothetical protein
MAAVFFRIDCVAGVVWRALRMIDVWVHPTQLAREEGMCVIFLHLVP